jgi:DNA-binding MarR family transcriptional regulator
MKLSSNDALLQIHRVIRSMHRRNRSVANAYGSSLSMLESAVLQEILANPQSRITALANCCRVSKVQVSRSVSALLDRGLLFEKENHRDKRSSFFELTPQGKKTFSLVSKKARVTFQSAFERLTKNEQIAFQKYLSLFLLEIDAPPASALTQDAGLMLEIRRLTRLFGFLSNEVFGIKGLSPLRWHILALISSASDGTTLSALANSIGIPLSTCASTVQGLFNEGLLKNRHELGKRLLFASRKGLQLHSLIEHKAVDQLRKGCRKFSEQELQHFAALWISYTGENTFRDDIAVAAHSGIHLVSSPYELQVLRNFLFQTRLQQNLSFEIPEVFAHPQSLVYSFLENGKIQGCVEISKREKAWWVQHCLFKHEVLSQGAPFALETIVEQAMLRSGAKKLVLKEANCSPAIRKILKISKKRGVYTITPASISRGELLR